MKRILMISTITMALLTGVSAQNSQASLVTALEFPPQTGTTASFVNGTDGWEFVPNMDIKVTTLGYYDDGANGLLTSHPVGIFNTATQALITPSVAINSASTLDGLFRFEPIAPVLLNAGQSYTVAGASVAPFDPLVFNPSGRVFAPELRFVGYRVGFGNSFAFPTQMQSNNLFASSNFQFEPAPVPVPASLLLFGSGLVGLVAWRWKHIA